MPCSSAAHRRCLRPNRWSQTGVKAHLCSTLDTDGAFGPYCTTVHFVVCIPARILQACGCVPKRTKRCSTTGNRGGSVGHCTPKSAVNSMHKEKIIPTRSHLAKQVTKSPDQQPEILKVTLVFTFSHRKTQRLEFSVHTAGCI